MEQGEFVYDREISPSTYQQTLHELERKDYSFTRAYINMVREKDPEVVKIMEDYLEEDAMYIGALNAWLEKARKKLGL